MTRISIDVLRSARVRREEYIGPWVPEPLLADPYQDPARAAELADSLSTAALVLLERLSPLERAVFVLRDVFGFGFDEVAEAVGRSQTSCRQLARAGHGSTWVPAGPGSRRTDGNGRSSRHASSRRCATATSTAFASCSRPMCTWSGMVEARRPDGRTGSWARNGWQGCWASLGPSYLGIGGQVQPCELNGQPGAIFRDPEDRVINTISVDILEGRIQTIRAVLNPDKLAHLGPPADVGAMLRDTQQARRSLE